MSSYTGGRIIPKPCGAWSSTTDYERLSIVYNSTTGISYMAKKAVPAGTALTDEEYWVISADYNRQFAALSSQIAANVTASTDGDADYAAEVVDARVDDFGKTHDSLGDNIRSIGAVRSFQNILDAWTMENGYVDASGTYVYSSSWRCCRYIPVAGEKVLISGRFGYLSGNDDFNNIWCYDKDRNSLGGAFRAESGVDYNGEEITLLDGTAFISVTTSSSYVSGSVYKSCVYLIPDVRTAQLLNNWATTWQVLNGQIEVTFSTSSDVVSIEVMKTSYLIHKVNGETYAQPSLSASSTELEFTPSGYWAIYWQESTDEDGNDTSGWCAASTSSNWDRLFTSDRFVLAVMYSAQVFYSVPVGAGTTSYLTINGVRYGNLSSELDALSEALDETTEAGEANTEEIADARVDDTGKTRSSIGDNIRSIGVVRTFQNILDAWTKSYGYINAEGTYVSGSSSSVWVCWRNIPVTGGKVLVSGRFGYMNGSDDYRNIWCYDSSGNSLGGVFRAESGVDYDHEEVELPDDTAYISVTTGSTYTSGNYQSRVYLMPDLRTNKLLNNWASTWQYANGRFAVTFSTSTNTVSVGVARTSYLIRRVNAETYKQTTVTTDSNVEVEFTPSGWWGIYWQEETDDDGNDVSAWHVETLSGAWDQLFTVDRFVLAVFYSAGLFYHAPLTVGNSNYFTINGVEYGDIPNNLDTALTNITHTAYLSNRAASGNPRITIDTEAGTMQVTGQTQVSLDNRIYAWLMVDTEAYAISEGALAVLQSSSPSALIFGIEYTGIESSKPNLYTTAEFMALGQNGYYIATFWNKMFLFPHMSTDMYITLDGTSYKAGELFYTDSTESFIEGKYRKALGSSTIYIASGSLAIDRDNLTIQVTGTMLGCPERGTRYLWINAQDEPIDWVLTSSPTYMSFLAYDAETGSINLYDASQFAALGCNGYYIASFYKGLFYNAHMSPDVKVTLDGTQYSAGALFFEDSMSYTPSYVRGAYDNDGISDIAIPQNLHCMEGRQLSCYYDSLSRFEGSENLYRFTYSTDSAGTTIKRNEMCWNYTPGADISDFTMTAIRLNRVTAANQETKTITVKVNHPLTTSLTKNVCIMGDSLVDNAYLTKEIWDMLDEDGDCVINHIGTRGGEGYEHEGRGSWSWYRYLQGDDYMGRSNAFWNTDDDCLDFQWYCEQNGYDGIDYMLIALGTNDVSQGTTAYSTFASLETIISRAKQFIDILLSEDRGFPNCKVGIGLIGPGADYNYLISASGYTFRKSANTLNQLYLSTFDNGAYHENVTCFSHGMMTNRKYAFPYTETAISNRYSETCRTLSNNVHPSQRGYQAWADGYYNMIRGFLTEDAEAAEASE